MMPIFQLSIRRYDEEIILVKNAMMELEKQCNVIDGFTLSKPFAKAGWAFFNLQITTEMAAIIEKSGLMEGSLGYRIVEQLKNFLESKGSQVKITKIDY